MKGEKSTAGQGEGMGRSRNGVELGWNHMNWEWSGLCWCKNSVGWLGMTGMGL